MVALGQQGLYLILCQKYCSIKTATWVGHGQPSSSTADTEEPTGREKLGIAMGTGQRKVWQEWQGGDGKQREEQGKSPGAMQSTQEEALSKGGANSWALTGLGSVEAGGGKPSPRKSIRLPRLSPGSARLAKKTEESLCPPAS